ncbi:MAG: hypothetical protein R3D59_06635 [Paracoccaceae bacterium]
MSRLLPASLLGRLALLSAVAMILAHFGGFWVFSAERTTAVRAAQRGRGDRADERIAALVEAADPAVQAQLIAAATTPALDVRSARALRSTPARRSTAPPGRDCAAPNGSISLPARRIRPRRSAGCGTA